jgi:hypothetical protein
VYSYGDINWIKTFLIPNMEDVYNRRLCINDRDFPIGVGLETLVRIRQPFILSSFSSPLVYFESDAPSTHINNKTGK